MKEVIGEGKPLGEIKMRDRPERKYKCELDEKTDEVEVRVEETDCFNEDSSTTLAKIKPEIFFCPLTTEVI